MIYMIRNNIYNVQLTIKIKFEVHKNDSNNEWNSYLTIVLLFIYPK